MGYCRIALLFILISGCRYKKEITLDISNSSQFNFDSAVGFVNDNRFFIKSIEPGKTLSLNIPISSIKLNSHDFIINLKVFSNNQKDTLSGMFYTDLGGYPNRKYLIDISPKNEVKIGIE